MRSILFFLAAAFTAANAVTLYILPGSEDMDQATLGAAMKDLELQLRRNGGTNPSFQDVHSASTILQSLLRRKMYNQFLISRGGPGPSTVNEELVAFTDYESEQRKNSLFNLRSRLRSYWRGTAGESHTEGPSIGSSLIDPVDNAGDEGPVGLLNAQEESAQQLESASNQQPQDADAPSASRPASQIRSARPSLDAENADQVQPERRWFSRWLETAGQTTQDQIETPSRSATADQLDSQEDVATSRSGTVVHDEPDQGVSDQGVSEQGASEQGVSEQGKDADAPFASQIRSARPSLDAENADQVQPERRWFSRWLETAGQTTQDQIETPSRSATADQLDSQEDVATSRSGTVVHDEPDQGVSDQGVPEQGISEPRALINSGSINEIVPAEPDAAGADAALPREGLNLNTPHAGSMRHVEHVVTESWQISVGVNLLDHSETIRQSTEGLFQYLMKYLLKCEDPATFVDYVAHDNTLSMRSYNDKLFTTFLGQTYMDFSNLDARGMALVLKVPNFYFPYEQNRLIHATEKEIRVMVAGAIKKVREETQSRFGSDTKSHYKDCMYALGKGYKKAAKLSKT